MIKGVNRQIIEVSETGNVYYEKAWLVVRTQYSDTEEAVLRSQAQKFVSEADSPSCVKSKRARGYLLFRMLLSAFAGSGLTIVIQALLKL
jgi:hypothetical protein